MAGEQFEDLLTDSEDDLPCGWEMRVTEAGRVYYVDHTDRRTQWQHPKTKREKYLPAELPFGWEKGTEEDGKVVFIDHIENRTTCVDPRIAYAMTEKKKAMVKCDGYSSAMAVLRGQDMRGKTALITGANSGIGYETAFALSLHGCHVVLACRNLKKGRQAVDLIKKNQRIPIDVDLVECDLASLASVKKCAEEVILKQWRVHILICNAGIMGLPYTVSPDGIECTFATNHLGHFYLVDLLKDVLVDSAPSRVVVVAGESHRFPSVYGSEFDVDDVPLKQSEYWPIVAYNQSKLCNLLFAFELNRRMADRGVTCNAVHPGSMVYTKLARNSYFHKLLYVMTRPFTKNQAQGASTTIYCAASPEMEGVGGYYFNNCCGCEPSSLAKDEELAERLWSKSEKLAYKKINADGFLTLYNVL